jgi:hypothetical protein
VCEQYVNGASVHAIALVHGITASNVKNIVSRAGVKRAKVA